jgi:hypothetical protein
MPAEGAVAVEAFWLAAAGVLVARVIDTVRSDAPTFLPLQQFIAPRGTHIICTAWRELSAPPGASQAGAKGLPRRAPLPSHR